MSRSFPVESWTVPARSTDPACDVSTMAVGGVPMLPPTWQGMPDSRRMWPISAVVVVLPFEPVMPMVSPCRNSRPVPTRRSPATPRCAGVLQHFGIGRNARRNHDQVGVLEMLRPSAAESACPCTSPVCFCVHRAHLRALREQQLRRRPRRTAPSPPPRLACRRSSSSQLQRGQREQRHHQSRIQKRMMIFDSCQPSASK